MNLYTSPNHHNERHCRGHQLGGQGRTGAAGPLAGSQLLWGRLSCPPHKAGLLVSKRGTIFVMQ